MFEFTAALRRAPRITTHHDVALLTEEVVPVIRRSSPAVVHGVDPRPPVNGHVDRVLFGGIEIDRLHHPAVQLFPGIIGEREELAGCHGVFGQRLPQAGVVFEQTDLAPLAVAQDIHRRRVRIAVVVDGVVKRLAPAHPVSARRLVQLGHPPLQIHLGQVLLRGACPGPREIDHLPLGIIALHGGDVPRSAGQLLVLLARAHMIEVIVPILHARHEKRAVLQECEVVLNRNVRGRLLDEKLLSGRRTVFSHHAKVEAKQLHLVLVPIHAHDHQIIGAAHPHDARDVIVPVHLAQCGLASGGHLHGIDAHCRVDFSGLWVLECVGGRVKRPVHRHAELPNRGLVKPIESDVLTIRRPEEPTVLAELLFVDPIRSAVDDSVPLSIIGELYFGLSSTEIGHMKVVVHHVSHFVTLRREGGQPNGLAVLAKRSPHLSTPQRVNMIVCRVAVAINRLLVAAHQHLFLIG